MTRETRTEWMHRNASGGGSIHPTLEEALAAQREHDSYVPFPVDDPPLPTSEGIWRREVTEWERLP